MECCRTGWMSVWVPGSQSRFGSPSVSNLGTLCLESTEQDDLLLFSIVISRAKILATEYSNSRFTSGIDDRVSMSTELLHRGSEETLCGWLIATSDTCNCVSFSPFTFVADITTSTARLVIGLLAPFLIPLSGPFV